MAGDSQPWLMMAFVRSGSIRDSQADATTSLVLGKVSGDIPSSVQDAAIAEALLVKTRWWGEGR